MMRHLGIPTLIGLFLVFGFSMTSQSDRIGLIQSPRRKFGDIEFNKKKLPGWRCFAPAG